MMWGQNAYNTALIQCVSLFMPRLPEEAARARNTIAMHCAWRETSRDFTKLISDAFRVCSCLLENGIAFSEETACFSFFTVTLFVLSATRLDPEIGRG
jgi:hypothetical protein